MKIELDKARCTGLGICESLADDYFEIADDGSLTLLKATISEEDLERVKQAVRSCPTEALKLTD
jgi:ferredoxin